MKGILRWLTNYDRTEENSDGSKFYGVDDKESKTTTWYDEDGNCDCITDTPSDDYDD